MFINKFNIWYGGYQFKISNILWKVTPVLRKRAIELNPSEEYSDLRPIFEFVGGILTRFKILRLLNGRVEYVAQLFTTIDNNFLNSNMKPLMIDSNWTTAYFKTYDK